MPVAFVTQRCRFSRHLNIHKNINQRRLYEIISMRFVIDVYRLLQFNVSSRRCMEHRDKLFKLPSVRFITYFFYSFTDNFLVFIHSFLKHMLLICTSSHSCMHNCALFIHTLSKINIPNKTLLTPKQILTRFYDFATKIGIDYTS